MNEAAKLPQGWIEATIPSIIADNGLFCDGDWIESKDQDPNGEIRLIQLADISDGVFKDKSKRYLTYARALELNCTFLSKGDILIARMPDPIGRACIFPLEGHQKFVTAVDIAIVRLGDSNVLTRYLQYAINNRYIRRKIEDLQSGTTRKRISRANLAKIRFRVPPLEEQHRIVAKIEELFSSLDKGIESLKAAQQQLKIYRQSVLKWAFEGRLTNNTQVGELPEGWKCEPLGEIAELCLGKMLDKEKNRGEYQPYLRNINVRWGTFDLSSLEMMRFEDSEKERYSVQLGELVICEGGEPGRCAIWTSNHTMYIQKALHRVRLLINYHPKYIYYYLFFLASNGQLEQYFTGTTIKHLTGRELKRIKILAPKKYSEQEEIISQIESRLSICDKLEESINQNLQQSDVLRQSILKKAFEGELVT